MTATVYSLQAIREGLVRALSVIPDVQVLPYMISDPTPPTIWVVAGPVTYDVAYARGADDLTMIVQAFVALTSDIAAQQRLDRFMLPGGPESVKAAIEAKMIGETTVTLGGACADLRVTGISRPQVEPAISRSQTGGQPLIAAEWRIEVEV